MQNGVKYLFRRGKKKMIDLKKYREAYTEYHEVEKEIKDKLTVDPVVDVVVFSPDNIKFDTAHYWADVHLNKPRDSVEIRRLYDDADLPMTEEEIAKYIKELTTEKQEFERYIDKLFETIH
jgi:hypothetical protein